MTLQSVVMLSLLSVAGCALLAFLALIFLYRRHDKRQQRLYKQTRLDIADMSILFQTMRDIISQQKALAKHFNQAIEQKTAGVKTVLAQSIEKNERLYEQQQALLAQIQEAQAQLQSLQRQMAYLDETVTRLTHDAPVPRVQEPDSPPLLREAAMENDPAPAALEESPPAATIQPGPYVEAAPPQAPTLEALMAAWLQGGMDTSPDNEEPAFEEPEAKHDNAPQATREAFRALLDMEPAGAVSPSDASTPPAAETSEANPSGNGGKTMVALQKRILEYNEAGMSVADISRELGIGKGEIRLMLSLAKQRRP